MSHVRVNSSSGPILTLVHLGRFLSVCGTLPGSTRWFLREILCKPVRTLEAQGGQLSFQSSHCGSLGGSWALAPGPLLLNLCASHALPPCSVPVVWWNRADYRMGTERPLCPFGDRREWTSPCTSGICTQIHKA